jgi:hypothetical protein
MKRMSVILLTITICLGGVTLAEAQCLLPGANQFPANTPFQVGEREQDLRWQIAIF